MIKKQFSIILLLYLISAIVPLMVPYATDKEGTLNTIGYAAGALFWIGLIGGSVGYFLLCRKNKNLIKREDNKKSFIRFFSNPPARVMDVVMVIGIIGTIYCMANIKVSQIVAAIMLTLLLAGIYAHFLLNGNVYQYIWNSSDKTNQILTEEKVEEGKE